LLMRDTQHYGQYDGEARLRQLQDDNSLQSPTKARSLFEMLGDDVAVAGEDGKAVGLKSKGLNCAKFVLGTHGKRVFLSQNRREQMELARLP